MLIAYQYTYFINDSIRLKQELKTTFVTVVLSISESDSPDR